MVRIKKKSQKKNPKQTKTQNKNNQCVQSIWNGKYPVVIHT